MSDVPLYQATILLLLVCGLVPACVFIGQHRPRQWRRLAAWDASGWVLICAFQFARQIVLTVTRWPGTPPRGLWDAGFAIGVLMLIDVMLIVRILSYRSFAQRDAERVREGRSDPIT